MHASAFDRYRAIDSSLHRLDPRVKVLVTVLFILSNALLPDGAWGGFGLAFAVLIIANLYSGLGWLFTLKQSYVALPFALAAVTVLFSLPGPALWTVELGSWQVVITQPGALRFLSILVRSWLSVQAAILLVAVTRFPDLLHALRHLKMPGILVSIIAFMYRYLFLLTDEVLRLRRAREARSAVLPGTKGGGSVLWRAKIAGSMAGQLFLRSIERSDRIYSAMLARGYAGQLLTLNPHVMKRADWLVLAASISLLIIVQAAARFSL